MSVSEITKEDVKVFSWYPGYNKEYQEKRNVELQEQLIVFFNKGFEIELVLEDYQQSETNEGGTGFTFVMRKIWSDKDLTVSEEI